MTRREQLLENYEDALFVLLMDQVAEEEGARLLKENEQLNRNPDAAIPAEADKRCRKTIKKSFAKNQRHKATQITYRAFNKIAVVATIGVFLFTTAYAAFPEVRIKTLNLLIEVSDVATSLTLGRVTKSAHTPDDNTVDLGGEQLLLGYRLPEIPDGFTVSYEGSDSKSAWIEYVNDVGATIYLRIGGRATAIYNVDTEDAQNVENIQIHGYDGLLIEKDEHIRIVWGDTEHEKFIEVRCTGTDKNVVLNLANEMMFVENSQN